MIDALCIELEMQKDYLKHEAISTIYIGGGTPSLLPDKSILKLLGTVNNNFNILQGTEITLEANPDDISEISLKKWKFLGVNRLSIGIQSFDDDLLKYMNRVHHSDVAIRAFNLARSCKYDNLNVDLIYGIPQPGHDRWQTDLDHIEELLPEHVSAYCLTIEDNTVFGKWFKQGKIQKADDDFCAEEFQMVTQRLKSIGYEHYEVSNFCLPGKESRHNSGYWQNQKYLGIGPGAHSFNRESRHFNISNNAMYVKAINKGILPNQTEKLSIKDKLNDYLLTSLRTCRGLSVRHLKDEWNFDILSAHSKYLSELENKRLCEIGNDTIKLTSSGFLLADKISAELFVE